MATYGQLKQALRAADQAGDTQAATKLAWAIKHAQPWVEKNQKFPDISGKPVDELQVPGTEPQQAAKPSPSLGDELVGAGEAGLNAVTGATGGALGMLGGALGGIAGAIKEGNFGTPEAAQHIHDAALQGAQELTYQPRTEAGKQDTAAVGKVVDNVVTPVAPMAGELQGISSGAEMAGKAAGDLGPAAGDAVAQAARKAALGTKAAIKKPGQAAATVAKSAKELVTGPEHPKPPGSVGAAQVEQGITRQANAQDLPVPIDLTKGQATRNFEQQKFERETAKNGTIGEPLREHFAKQNNQLSQNMDAFIDQTGSELHGQDLQGIGEKVTKTLQDRAARDKNKIRALYKAADKNGETLEPVDLQPLIDELNQSKSAESTAPVLKAAKAELQRLGGAVEDPNTGDLVSTHQQPKAGPGHGGLTLSDAEQLRKFINKTTGNDPTNIKFAADLKDAIDQATEGKGGKLYQQARQARRKYAQDYENVGLVKNLLGTKRGTEDRAIALEDVLRKSVLNPGTSVEQLRHLKRLLMTKTGGKAGPGVQAWKELQAGTLNYLQDQMTRNMQLDQAGNRVVSPAGLDRALKRLEHGGKLDYIFGKDGANKLRLINDVAQDVMTSPPGTVNFSNTASVLAAMMDVTLSGLSGVPAPVASTFRYITSHVRDAKLRAQVKDALGGVK